jgi:hypothetical protein
MLQLIASVACFALGTPFITIFGISGITSQQVLGREAAAGKDKPIRHTRSPTKIRWAIPPIARPGP